MSGYRPTFWLDEVTRGVPGLHGAAIELVGVEMLNPGAEASAIITPLVPHWWPDVRVGDRIEFYEGPRKIGSVVATESMARMAD